MPAKQPAPRSCTTQRSRGLPHSRAQRNRTRGAGQAAQLGGPGGRAVGGTPGGHLSWKEALPTPPAPTVSHKTRPMKRPVKGRQPGHAATPAFRRERARRSPTHALLPWTTHERHGRVSSRFRNRHGSERVLIPGTKRAATGPRLPEALICDSPATRSATVAGNSLHAVSRLSHTIQPQMTESCRHVPDCRSRAKPVETAGIEPASAIA